MIYIVMGVSGSGKSTIGKMLADHLELPYIEADDHHPRANIKKMKRGLALNDLDRAPWLEALRLAALQALDDKGAVISCSALKQSYRDNLSKGLESYCHWIYLAGGYEDILTRMKLRDHFMPTSLLISQFEILEEPTNAIKIDIHLSPSEIISNIVSHIRKSNMKKEWGLIGLGVMGKSLSLNLAEKGVTLALFNRHVDGQEENVANDFISSDSLLHGASGFDDLNAFVNDLASPRRIQLMVNAGVAVDMVIDELIPLLSKGDIIIDGGNSHYRDTKVRSERLAKLGLKYFGVGISGGEEGARKGPSIMPGGSADSYQEISPMLEKIAAKDAHGGSCCTFIGPDGAGHFVKMVHNGIEYAEMQLIAEVCDIAFNAYQLTPDELADKWETWVTPEGHSYLLEITLDILRKKENGEPLVHQILDKAGNKGTGSWTTVAASEYGVASTMIAAALFARYTSSYLTDRKKLAKSYQLKKTCATISNDISAVFEAYHTARWINHHQGFALIFHAAKAQNWQLNLSEIARIWTNGCIIRSGMMIKCQEILKSSHDLLIQEEIRTVIEKSYKPLCDLVRLSLDHGISIPCHLASLDYLHAMTNERSSAYIIQAQRDYFGAHTYQRIDDPSGKAHHTIW